MLAAAHASSFSIGALVLQEIGDIAISGRGLNKAAVKIGMELASHRDARVESYFAAPLPRTHTVPATPIELACVSIDGGRMQTRTDGGGQGVFDPHWRETKNALFLRMTHQQFSHDPQPLLPLCFGDRNQMKSLLTGVCVPDADDVDSADARRAPLIENDWRPRRVFRTCLSSLVDSTQFGRMMEVEADSRGFYHARNKVFVSDGLAYNWTIQQRHFPDFVPILDFVHAAEHLYEAARCVHDEWECQWTTYRRWAQMCWSGLVAQVIAEMKQHQQNIGPPPRDCDQTDARKILADNIGYFENNASRMKYPEYRRQGLPTTPALMESFVKELSARVKGTEKFWNDGQSGEAILQLRAAALCDDDRLSQFLKNRPGHPFHPNVPATQLKTAI